MNCAYRKPRLAHYGSRRAHVTHYKASLHLVDFKCASSFGEGQVKTPEPGMYITR